MKTVDNPADHRVLVILPAEQKKTDPKAYFPPKNAASRAESTELMCYVTLL